MEEITAIELLREVLLGEKKMAIPPNSIQLRKAKQQQLSPHQSSSTPSKPATNANYVSDDDNDDALPDLDGNYSDSDDKDDEVKDAAINPRARRSKNVMQQIGQNEREDLHRISSLAARNKSPFQTSTSNNKS